jgi:hypothetical protein
MTALFNKKVGSNIIYNKIYHDRSMNSLAIRLYMNKTSTKNKHLQFELHFLHHEFIYDSAIAIRFGVEIIPSMYLW